MDFFFSPLCLSLFSLDSAFLVIELAYISIESAKLGIKCAKKRIAAKNDSFGCKETKRKQ